MCLAKSDGVSVRTKERLQLPARKVVDIFASSEYRYTSWRRTVSPNSRKSSHVIRTDGSANVMSRSVSDLIRSNAFDIRRLTLHSCQDHMRASSRCVTP